MLGGSSCSEMVKPLSYGVIKRASRWEIPELNGSFYRKMMIDMGEIQLPCLITKGLNPIKPH